jgi:hypothetical protein
MSFFFVVLYGCEMLSLARKEEHRLRVFEFRMLRRIFLCKGEEVTGSWRKLHNEKLIVCMPLNVKKSRRIEWVGHGASMEEMRNAYKILVSNSDGKGQHGRIRWRWEDNIKMNIKEMMMKTNLD